eukprot:1161342-Pelagomonas_calceolata.AAC.8
MRSPEPAKRASAEMEQSQRGMPLAWIATCAPCAACRLCGVPHPGHDWQLAHPGEPHVAAAPWGGAGPVLQGDAGQGLRQAGGSDAQSAVIAGACSHCLDPVSASHPAIIEQVGSAEQ